MKLLKLSLIALVLAFTFACADEETNPPTMSLSVGGKAVNMNEPVAFNSYTVANPDNKTIVTFSSSADGGISSLTAVGTAEEDPYLNVVFTLFGEISLTDPKYNGQFDFFLPVLVPNMSSVKNSSSFNLDLSYIAELMFTDPDRNADNMTLEFTVSDANGTAKQLFTFDITDNATSDTYSASFIVEKNSTTIISSYITDNITYDNFTSGKAEHTYTVAIDGEPTGTDRPINYLMLNISSDNETFEIFSLKYTKSIGAFLGGIGYLGIDLFDTKLLEELGIDMIAERGTTTPIELNINDIAKKVIDKIAQDAGVSVSEFAMTTLMFDIHAGNAMENASTQEIKIDLRDPAPLP